MVRKTFSQKTPKMFSRAPAHPWNQEIHKNLSKTTKISEIPQKRTRRNANNGQNLPHFRTTARRDEISRAGEPSLRQKYTTQKLFCSSSSFLGFPIFLGVFGSNTAPGGPGRGLESLPEGVASFSLSMGPWRATGTPFMTKITDLGHPSRVRGSRNTKFYA